MRKVIMTLAIALVGVAAQAKDIKTVIFTTQPQMHCAGCEKKIKGNLRYEKGVKRIDTDVEQQKVTVKYDADKTSVCKLQAAFDKIGYKASQVTTDEKGCCKDNQAKAEKKDCCKDNQAKAEKKGCCKDNQAKTEKKGCCSK